MSGTLTGPVATETCSGDVYVAVPSSECSFLTGCAGQTVYALCTGSSYTACDCAVPSGYGPAPSGSPDGGTSPDGGATPDGGGSPDTGANPEGGPSPDAGASPESGTPPDGGTSAESGNGPETGTGGG